MLVSIAPEYAGVISWGPRMLRWIFSAGVLAVALFAIPVAARGQDYRLALQVQRDGLVIAKTTADTVENTTADLRFGLKNSDESESEPGSTTGDARILVSIGPSDGGMLTVHLKYLELMNSTWSILSEPTLVVGRNDEGSVAFSANAENGQPVRYSITVLADNLAQDASPTRSVASRCPSQSSDLLSPAVRAPDGTDPKCCSTKEMTCCNVKKCCDNRPGHGDCCGTK